MLKKDDTARRWYIDRNMIGILSVFSVLGVCLLIIVVVASNTMSALRAYSTLQTHWTESRKEATYLFVEYLREQDEEYLAEFRNSLKIINAARSLREELFKPETDRERAKVLLLETKANPNDLDNMITTFHRFHSFPDFADAINAWIESDRLVDEIRTLAEQGEALLDGEQLTDTRRQQLIDRTRQLDEQLTQEQYKLASSLAAGTGLLSRIIFGISLSLGGILLIVGSVLSIRFMRSIREWKRAIEVSRQRYESLFKQNPNAVFSATTEGRIVNGNEAIKSMIGYDEEEIIDLKLDRLIAPDERERVRNLFMKALQNKPQGFETRMQQKGGTPLTVYMTCLPIFVEDKIVGVFGIADDISYQKQVEEEIKQQLNEKTVLLSEVHDRVKNNLALISGLLQLQKDDTDDEATRNNLETAKSRIHSMAMVHEHLYHVESFSNIRIDEYAKELIGSIQNTYKLGENSNHVTIEADPVTLDVKRAIPCGLLLNELILNYVKSASKESGKREFVMHLIEEENDVRIRIRAVGKEFRENLDINEQENLSTVLISTLAKQLDAELNIKAVNGSAVEINLRFHGNSTVLKSA